MIRFPRASLRRRAAASAIAVSVLAASLVPAAPALAGGLGGGPAACRVANVRTGSVTRTLLAAVIAAEYGDTLRVRGTCVGLAKIPTTLAIVGVRPAGAPMPTLSGGGTVPILSVGAGAAVLVSGLRLRNGDGSSCVNPYCPGAAYVGEGARLFLRDVTVTGNRSTTQGAFEVAGGTLVIAGKSRVIGNTATDEQAYAGGISVYNGGIVVVRDRSIIARNTGGFGGGIYLGTDSTLRLLGRAQVARNIATEEGGGVYVEVGAALLRMAGKAVIHHNSAPAPLDGGGIWTGLATYEGVVCGTNVRDNTPEDCGPCPPIPTAVRAGRTEVLALPGALRLPAAIGRSATRVDPLACG